MAAWPRSTWPTTSSTTCRWRSRQTAADSTQVIAAIDRLSGKLRERIGESLRSVRSEPPLTQVTTSSLEALWKYTKGQVAGDAGGDYVSAVALLKEAVALDSGFATAYRTLGGFQEFLGNRTESVAALTKAIQHEDRLTEIEREHTRGNYHVGVTGQLDQAMAAYRAALELNPGDSLARQNLGMVYDLMHQPERAESIFRAGLDTLHPWSPIPHLALAATLVTRGRRAEAEQVYSQIAKLFPGHPAVEERGVLLAASTGDYLTAAARARRFRERHAREPLDRGGCQSLVGRHRAGSRTAGRGRGVHPRCHGGERRCWAPRELPQGCFVSGTHRHLGSPPTSPGPQNGGGGTSSLPLGLHPIARSPLSHSGTHLCVGRPATGGARAARPE